MQGIIAVAVVVVAVAALIGAKLLGAGTGGTSSRDNQPVPAAVLAAITQTPATTLDAAGAGTGAGKVVRLPGPLWKTSDGKAEVLYVGAEYCPYCASQRWALIVALSRFGQFNGLELMTSASDDVYPSTPTFTFAHATYASQYLAFSAVEETTNKRQGNQYAPLQTPTTDQQQRVQKYDAPPYVAAGSEGSIPFLDVADTLMVSGTLVDPGLLQGKDWAAIAQSLQHPESDPGRKILSSANVLTAALCYVDGHQPDSVCSSPGVAQVKLPS